VAATSASNAWAVGYIAGHGPLILHWNGTAWKRSPLPSTARERMKGVAATSATNAWAISSRSNTNSRIWHWNGKRWSRVSFPLTPGHLDFLDGVTATSARNAWAVGGSFSPHAVTLRTVIFHWNGARWTRTPSPNPSGALGDVIFAVSAVSPSDAWAVGTSAEGPESVTEHWDGTSWKAVPSGYGVLAGVSVLLSGRAWAVGSIGNRTPQILHWNGSAWHPVPLS
jgi:hypothetical protein